MTPAGDRLVVVGNFRTVGGLARDQIVMIDLTGATAAVSTTWYTTLLHADLLPQRLRQLHARRRDVAGRLVLRRRHDRRPAQRHAVRHRRPLRDYAVGTTLTPTWTDTSGGDTLWGVEITQAAVYVGGHKRWMNNPQRLRPRRPGRRAAARAGRARPADRRAAEVEPGPQPAR